MTSRPPEQLEDQVERTLLAWRRTALSLVAAGLLVAHISGGLGLLVTLVGTTLVVALVWLRPGNSQALSALAMSSGVVLLGGVALAEVLLKT